MAFRAHVRDALAAVMTAMNQRFGTLDWQAWFASIVPAVADLANAEWVAVQLTPEDEEPAGPWLWRVVLPTPTRPAEPGASPVAAGQGTSGPHVEDAWGTPARTPTAEMRQTVGQAEEMGEVLAHADLAAVCGDEGESASAACGKTIWVDDASALAEVQDLARSCLDTGAAQWRVGSARRRGGGAKAHSWYAVPLPGRGGSLGVLMVGWSHRVRALPASRLRALAVVGRYVAGAYLRDLTLRRVTRAEAEARRMKRLYATLSQSNQAIVRIRDREALLARLCEIMVQDGEMQMCWLGFAPERGAGDTPPVLGEEGECVWAHDPAVDGEAFLASLRFSPDPHHPFGVGLAGQAMREGRVLSSEDLARDPRPLPWREAALAQGARSTCVAPLHDGDRIGVLVLFAAETGFFDATAVNLITELAQDIDYALRSLRLEHDKQESQTVLASVLDTALDGIVVVDAHGRVEYANARTAELFACDVKTLVGAHFETFLLPTERRRMRRRMERAFRPGQQRPAARLHEVLARTADGSVIPLEVSVGEMPGPQGQRFTAVLRDVRERKATERKLLHLAFHDPVTGLWNRPGLERAFRRLTPAWRAVVMLEVRDLRTVNNSLGYQTGDRLLRTVAQRLERRVGGRELVGRLDGGTFVAVLDAPFVAPPLSAPPYGDGEAAPPASAHVYQASRQKRGHAAGEARDVFAAIDAAVRCLTAVSDRPFRVDGHTFHLQVAAGYAVLPTDAGDWETALRRANLALREAGPEAERRTVRFVPAFEETFLRVREIESAFDQARERGELTLQYQPQVSLRSETLHGVEALVRWRRPDGDLRMPGEFLPYLHDPDMVARLGDWVLNAALSQQERWRQAGLDVPVAVNVTPDEFLAPGFVTRVAAAMRRHGTVRAGDLELEITETAALRDLAASRSVIGMLHELGVRVALDDFGTGYASVRYLQELPVDTVKIDQAFTRDLTHSSDAWGIVQAIQFMGLSLDRTVLAEGVETLAHSEALVRQGVEYMQGYAFARPLPAEELPEWLAVWQRTQRSIPRASRDDAVRSFLLVATEYLHLRWIERVRTAQHHPELPVDLEELTGRTACHLDAWVEARLRGSVPDAAADRLLQLHLGDHMLARRLLERSRQAGPDDPAAQDMLTQLARDEVRFLALARALFFPHLRGGTATVPDGGTPDPKAR